MSFVLDALKVSEQRRSRFRRRVYAHPPRPRGAGRGRGWLVAPGVLTGIALVVLGWRLATPSGGPVSPSAPRESGPGAGPAAGTAVAEAPGTAAAGTAAAESGEIAGGPGPAMAGAAAEPERHSAGPQAQSVSGDQRGLMPESASEQDRAPGLLAAAPQDWPALSLQMLFFSEQGERSFVQVNGKTYRAGERLAAGPRVVKIARDGVTLEYRGQRVLLGVER